MKATSIILFILIYRPLSSQNYTAIESRLNSFKSSISENDSAVFWLENILNHRDIETLKSHIDTIHAVKIKIIEVYDNQLNKYGIREDYAKNDVIIMAFMDNMIDTFYDYNFVNNKIPIYFNDTINSTIKLFPPNTIESFCGCGQVPRRARKNCLKDAEMRAKNDGITCEHFARLITYIDKSSGKISFVLEMPMFGQRKVYQGLTFDFSNKRWFDE